MQLSFRDGLTMICLPLQEVNSQLSKHLMRKYCMHIASDQAFDSSLARWHDLTDYMPDPSGIID
ncbi:hypothetical protein D1823_21020 (plasmid) [Ruegeria sp. AD91A]|nr:hypothetical protein D1823_21020 [Ruegeria sp. AD91A]